MTAIQTGRGHFVDLLSYLVAGVIPTTSIDLNIYSLRDKFHSLEEMRLSRRSRKGWETLQHPMLGLLQWKLGVSPFRGYYFFLRVNGKPVLEQTGYNGSLREDGRPRWTAPAAQKLDPLVREDAEDWLRRKIAA